MGGYKNDILCLLSEFVVELRSSVCRFALLRETARVALISLPSRVGCLGNLPSGYGRVSVEF